MKKIYLISVSGGKDSQASMLYMKEHYGNRNLVAYTADTGWEHELTYQHIDYLSKTVMPIEVIRSDKYAGFEDMCIKRKGFPVRIGRFCTEELKVFPSNKYIRSWQKNGYRVINVVGVRRDESAKRSGEGRWKTSFLGKPPKMRKVKGEYRYPAKKTMRKYYSRKNTVTIFQPIVDWTARDSLEYNIKQGTKNNPLYAMGFTRVGCMPCIMANNLEVGLLSDFHITRIRNLENEVAKVSNLLKNNKPTFFQTKSKTGKGDKKNIDEYIAGKKYNTLGFDLGCINQFGICE